MRRDLRTMKMIGIGAFMCLTLSVAGCSAEAQKSGTEIRQENPTELREEQTGAQQQEEPQEEQPDRAESSGNQEEGETSKLEEMSGEVQALAEGGFTIAEILVTTEQDGGETAALPAEGEQTLLEVETGADTSYHIISSSDGGATSTEEEGTAADLEEGMIVYLLGKRTEEGFRAKKVTMYQFE